MKSCKFVAVKLASIFNNYQIDLFDSLVGDWVVALIIWLVGDWVDWLKSELIELDIWRLSWSAD